MGNFLIAIEPYLKVANFLGLIKICPDFKKSSKVLRSSLFNVHIILILLLLTIINIYHYIYFLSAGEFFESIIWSWLIMTRIPSILIQVLVQCYYSNELNIFLKFIFECDRKMRKIKVSINHKRDKKIILLILVPVLLLPSLYYVVLVFSYFKYDLIETGTIILELSYTIDLIYSCFFCAQFAIFTIIIKNRFKLLKKSLR